MPSSRHSLNACLAMQDVERECAAACASLAMPMPLNVSLRSEDLAQLQQRLLVLLMQPDPAVPFTPSLKVFSEPLSRPFWATDWRIAVASPANALRMSSCVPL